MSADRQRLKSAIRRIALTPEERRQLLGDGQNKGGKASSAGVGTSEAEESRLCCDGSTSSNANPGTGERDPDSSSQDGLNPDDPAKLESGDGTLSGVTDCATGQPVCFDGSGFIPPEGWEDPNEPPIDPAYQESVYHLVRDGDGGESYYQTCGPALAAYESILSGCGINSTAASCDPYQSSAITGGGACGGATFIKKSCSNDYNAICDEPPPVAESWPSDGCTNLIVKGGKIVGSKYDPENDGSWSAPRDEVDLCDAFGNSFTLKASGSIEGGWKSISSQNPDDGYLYNAQGQQIARISESEYSDPTI